MRVWVYLCVVSSHINIIGRYVMRVWVYLCIGVFLYQYHRLICDESVGLPVCCVFSYQYHRLVCDESVGLPVFCVFSYLNHRS